MDLNPCGVGPCQKSAGDLVDEVRTGQVGTSCFCIRHRLLFLPIGITFEQSNDSIVINELAKVILMLLKQAT